MTGAQDFSMQVPRGVSESLGAENNDSGARSCPLGGSRRVFIVVLVEETGRFADLACVERVGCLLHVPVPKIRPADQNSAGC